MINFNNKKSGFTLMEIALAVLIIAILTLALLPVFQSQLKKSDEYSYYMAYKTVEKLAGQIVAIGDEEELSSDSGNIIITENNNGNLLSKSFQKSKAWLAIIGAKLAFPEQYLFSHLFPKAYGASNPTTNRRELFSGEEYSEYQNLFKVCGGEEVCDETASKDIYKKECDASGNNCVIKSKCDSNKQNCCDSAKLYLKDVNSCDAKYKFTQKYKKCVKTKDESGNWSSEVCSDNVTSCDSISSDSKIVTCTKSNSYKEEEVCHYITSANMGTDAADGDNEDSEAGSCPKNDSDTENMIADFFQDGSCSSYSENMDFSAMLASMKTGMSASSFCYKYNKKYCTPTGDTNTSYSVEYSGDTCYSVVTTKSQEFNTGSDSTPVSNKVTDTCKPLYGYYNMKNAGGSYSVTCVCSDAYLYSSANNAKACCKKPASGKTAYAKTNLSPKVQANKVCIECSGDFNPNNGGYCCPENSVYDGSSSCTCVEGYNAVGSGSSMKCKFDGSKCPKGTHAVEKDEVCVPNAPIVKAKRFCEEIVNNWNTKSGASACPAFNDEQYNSAVYKAAGGEAKRYLSINSTPGSFAGLTPHVTLANGLKLWILGNKMASIPGLSYSPTKITSSQNLCKDVTDLNGANPKTSSSSCSAAGEYFCSGEKHCYSLVNPTDTVLPDARNCCSTSDVTDLLGTNTEDDVRYYAISGFTIFVDINGNKGSGTLWEDVFPFFIGANGTVYPAYPLDAKKGINDSSSLYLGGNSSKMLPADVYYFQNDDSNDKRNRYMAYSNVSYARAACKSKLVSENTPYCLNLGDKFHDINGTNPCDSHKCFVRVKNKIKFL